jgi:hypothetical protein
MRSGWQAGCFGTSGGETPRLRLRALWLVVREKQAGDRSGDETDREADEAIQQAGHWCLDEIQRGHDSEPDHGPEERTAAVGALVENSEGEQATECSHDEPDHLVEVFEHVAHVRFCHHTGEDDPDRS